MAVTFNEFTQAYPDVNLTQDNSFLNSLNLKRMGYSASIGAAGAYKYPNSGFGSFMTMVGGFTNGFANSEESAWGLGKVFDGIKGAVEAYFVKQVMEAIPQQYRGFATLAVGALGAYTGFNAEDMTHKRQQEDLLIQQQMANNPALEMMSGGNRDEMLRMAKEQSKENYDYIQDPAIRNHFKMT